MLLCHFILYLQCYYKEALSYSTDTVFWINCDSVSQETDNRLPVRKYLEDIQVLYITAKDISIGLKKYFSHRMSKMSNADKYWYKVTLEKQYVILRTRFEVSYDIKNYQEKNIKLHETTRIFVQYFNIISNMKCILFSHIVCLPFCTMNF